MQNLYTQLEFYSWKIPKASIWYMLYDFIFLATDLYWYFTVVIHIDFLLPVIEVEWNCNIGHDKKEKPMLKEKKLMIVFKSLGVFVSRLEIPFIFPLGDFFFLIINMAAKYSDVEISCPLCLKFLCILSSGYSAFSCFT